jgi:coenzyme PQQ precursor peptide PqqA
MTWKTPTVAEIALGAEINSYASATESKWLSHQPAE